MSTTEGKQQLSRKERISRRTDIAARKVSITTSSDLQVDRKEWEVRTTVCHDGPRWAEPFLRSCQYSRTPLIRTLVIRLSNYPDLFGPSSKQFLIVIVLHLFVDWNFPPQLSDTFNRINQLDAIINYRFTVCRLDTTQHVSGILMPIIRSLSTAAAVSGLP